MSIADLAIVATLVFGWGALSARMERFDVTAPIAFVITGLLLTHGPLAFLGIKPSNELIKDLAEFTLVLIFFTDAARVGLPGLRADAGVYLRLLAGALPLTPARHRPLALCKLVGAATSAAQYGGVGLSGRLRPNGGVLCWDTGDRGGPSMIPGPVSQSMSSRTRVRAGVRADRDEANACVLVIQRRDQACRSPRDDWQCCRPRATPEACGACWLRIGRPGNPQGCV